MSWNTHSVGPLLQAVSERCLEGRLKNVEWLLDAQFENIYSTVTSLEAISLANQRLRNNCQKVTCTTMTREVKSCSQVHCTKCAILRQRVTGKGGFIIPLYRFVLGRPSTRNLGERMNTGIRECWWDRSLQCSCAILQEAILFAWSIHRNEDHSKEGKEVKIESHTRAWHVCRVGVWAHRGTAQHVLRKGVITGTRITVVRGVELPV